jgi:hypothetical protein
MYLIKTRLLKARQARRENIKEIIGGIVVLIGWFWLIYLFSLV